MRALRRVRGSTRTDVRPDRFIAVVTTEHLGEVDIRAYRALNSPLVVEFPSDPGSASIPSTLKRRCHLTPPRPSEEKPGNTSATKSSAEKSCQTEPRTMEPKPPRAISGVTVGESLDAKNIRRASAADRFQIKSTVVTPVDSCRSSAMYGERTAGSLRLTIIRIVLLR